MPTASTVTVCSMFASNGCRIDDQNSRRESRHAREIRHAERQQVRRGMHVADRNKARIMDLLPNDAQRADRRLPRRVDVRCLRQQEKRGFETRCLRLCVGG